MDREYLMQERKAKEINLPVSTFRKGGNLKKKKIECAALPRANLWVMDSFSKRRLRGIFNFYYYLP